MTGRASVVRNAFLAQADACDKLGSPFTARLCQLLSRRLDDASIVGRKVLAWPGDPNPSADSVPLRLCGALNNLVITGRDPRLAGVYPPGNDRADNGRADDVLWPQVERALLEHAPYLSAFIDSPPQTNEVCRSAVLLAGWCWLTRHFGLPLLISELGASAGLNLFADQYRLKTAGFERGTNNSPVVLPVDWRGDVPPQAEPVIVARSGCDIAPVDPGVKEQRDRLLSYVWPDQRDRVERTVAAIGIAAGHHFSIDRADAADWLERRLATAWPNAVHVVQHTIAWQYFPDAAKARALDLLDAAGARASARSPLARLWLEADGKSPGAGIFLTLWPGGKTVSLGRADFHGRWVDWCNPHP